MPIVNLIELKFKYISIKKQMIRGNILGRDNYVEQKIIDVVGTMFFKDGKLLIDKPRKRPTFQMIGGKCRKRRNTFTGRY